MREAAERLTLTITPSTLRIVSVCEERLAAYKTYPKAASRLEHACDETRRTHISTQVCKHFSRSLSSCAVFRENQRMLRARSEDCRFFGKHQTKFSAHACSNVYVCRAIEIVRCVVYVFICIFMKM
ncbi:hypothetical protein AVEN_152990-1 [Araneus ventricosus]|uniref:Uncharacterized protein n=1 Tax=Araneus ventricosus TaxID=182803 RepID=A0A4Y2ADF2_ARAVE|nr:hypothetical protein AVEN_152990-1 [Araneus ventricosus]